MSKLLVVFGDRTADEVLAAFRRTPGAASFDRVEKWFYQQDGSATEIEAIASDFQKVYFNVAVVDEYLRLEIVDIATQLGWRPWTVVDPLAWVDPTAELGSGCFVAAHAVLSCRARLGDFGIVHFQAMLGHDVIVGRHGVFLPGSKVSGGVVRGERCLVGANGFVHQNAVLGDRVKVDALGYAKGILPGGTVVSARKDIGARG
jgi:UDP-3-O-[3-hydroxymyristoyl] glucosamine N-acyltransferase